MTSLGFMIRYNKSNTSYYFEVFWSEIEVTRNRFWKTILQSSIKSGKKHTLNEQKCKLCHQHDQVTILFWWRQGVCEVYNKLTKQKQTRKEKRQQGKQQSTKYNKANQWLSKIWNIPKLVIQNYSGNSLSEKRISFTLVSVHSLTNSKRKLNGGITLQE